MKLKKCVLANFRGLEHLDIDFAEDVTVIAGVNGVGKSAVLSALVAAMSLALPRITVSKEPLQSFADADIQTGKSGLSVSVAIDLETAAVNADITRVVPLEDSKVTALVERRNHLRFARRETRRGSSEEQDIDDELRRIEVQLGDAGDNGTVGIVPRDPEVSNDELAGALKAGGRQPIAVFYSTSRFLTRLSPALSKMKPLSAENAYERSLSQLEISLNDFANWYRVISETELPDTKERLFGQLEQAVNVFLKDVSSLELHQQRRPRFSVLKNGQRLYLEQLSDGERGLLALVFDLTRRLSIANFDSENPIAEGSALVLIDEIELHLHPSWQRRVLRLLRRVFAQCQFVITTHSPQVIGQVRPEQLRLLHYDDEANVVLAKASQSFGMDSSWVLQHIMGVPARDYETERRLSAIYQAIDDDKLDEAQSLAENLRLDIGDFPDLQEAQALLDRFTLLGAE